MAEASKLLSQIFGTTEGQIILEAMQETDTQ